jgi:serine/threonine protein kinase
MQTRQCPQGHEISPNESLCSFCTTYNLHSSQSSHIPESEITSIEAPDTDVSREQDPPLSLSSLISEDSSVAPVSLPSISEASSVAPVASSRRHSTETGSRSFGFVKADIQFSSVDFPHECSQVEERYEALTKIAEGGMGVIFLVIERISGRAVALKVIKRKARNDQSLIQQFIREAVISARLQHPGIIPVYEIGFLTGDELYYTMRYVEGAPFSHHLRAHSSSLSARLQVLRQAALGVHYAHGEGLWHRDIKPANILVGKYGEVHVIDWGLVTVDRQAQTPYTLKLPRLQLRDRTLEFEGIDLLLYKTDRALTTQSDVFAGTPHYMAPEQLGLNDQAMGPRSDIWSFGVMLYEAIAERYPFGPSTEPQLVLIDAIKSQPPPALQLLAPSAPPKLVSLCEKMLEKNPDHRLSSLAEFVAELEASRVLSREPPSVLSSSISTSNSPHIPNILLDNRYQREEIAILRELVATGLFQRRKRRELRKKLAELQSRPAGVLRAK